MQHISSDNHEDQFLLVTAHLTAGNESADSHGRRDCHKAAAWAGYH